MEPQIESASEIVKAHPQIQTHGQMTKDEWHKKYWFSPLQMIRVINPLPTDYKFMVELRHFKIDGGAEAEFPGMVANVYLDQMSKMLAQEDDNLGVMGDPELKKHYYNKLIVDVRSLVEEQDPTPAYLRNVQDVNKVAPANDELPPWEQKANAPIAPTAPELPIEPPKEEKDEVKEFEYNGLNYKAIIAKNGKRMFYKNGQLTSEAEYAKAASLL